MSRTRRLALPVAALLAGALVAPAVADSTTGVPVSLVSLGGTRQFAVETVSGTALTAIPLGTGGAFPFRTHVTDTAFSNLTQNYAVSATMSNLYLASGGNHNFAVKVPSSDVSLAYATQPLSALGLSLTDLPKLSLTGTLQSCANLPSTVQTTLGLSPLGALVDPTDVALASLCTALGAGVPVAATVDGVLQNVAPTITSLLDLPTALTGAEPGAFSNPAFAGTVGAADPAAAGAPAATPRRIMTGTPGVSAGLLAALTNALNTALAGVPLTTATDAGARTTLAAAVSALQSSGTLAVATVGNALATLSADKQVAVINSLASSLVPPVLGNIASVNGQFFGFPILQATPSTPVAGTYDGTLTVTFVQN